MDPIGNGDLHASQLDAVFNCSFDAIAVTDSASKLVAWNRAAEELFGYPAEEALGLPVDEVFVPADARHVIDGALGFLIAEGEEVEDLDTTLVTRSKDPIDVSIGLRPIRQGDEIAGAAIVIRNITERRDLERHLAHQAFHDELTGLPNRQLFQELVARAVETEKRKKEPFAIVLADVDDFSAINHGFGSDAGDGLLKDIAQRLGDAIRPSDVMSRLDGDNFGILLDGLNDPSDVGRIVDRVSSTLLAPFNVGDMPLPVRASLGVSVTDGRSAAPSLIRDAEAALHVAKEKGKARAEVFEPGMRSAVLRRLELKTNLQKAIETGQICAQYQPIVDLRTGKIVGTEALARWDHPEHGLVPPADFVPLAEETGLIVPLGRYVLNLACSQASQWRAKFPDSNFQMSVNLSVKQLHDDSLISDIERALEGSGLPGESLILELTESIFAANIEALGLKLGALKDLGVTLALDDFGTGYSSLNYLNRFPIDIIKIDRAFVRGFTEGPERSAVGRAILKVSQILRVPAIAEGIELSEQVSELRNFRCPWGQGFYFAKPLDATALEALFAGGSFSFEWLDDWQRPEVVQIPEAHEGSALPA